MYLGISRYCCLVKVDCGQKTRQITSYFQNPNWPEASQDRIICTLTVELQSNVVQILIEFLTFEVNIRFCVRKTIFECYLILLVNGTNRWKLC